MIRRALLLALAALAVAPGATAGTATAGKVLVRLDTTVGSITLALDRRHAPITTANFLRYIDEKRLVGTAFYRASRVGRGDRGLIQGGTRNGFPRVLPPIAHEPTSRTGLRHVTGTISMSREKPGSATGDFFITIGAMPTYDAHGKDPGYAAFGQVVAGMPTVRRILAAPTTKHSGYEGMRNQMITNPIRITGTARVG
ncbi:MAG TPA: peptidylprolyl isomerase [Sphingomonas sp.]|jgi:peptidyl-prolyl cis-trans isomerase A (cyclophilin A)|uniref:peptidylprolyl isomerase n=1 Tax=Sphingomonas sp. TaxID=28214 RepID=UPI002EDB6024